MYRVWRTVHFWHRQNKIIHFIMKTIIKKKGQLLDREMQYFEYQPSIYIQCLVEKFKMQIRQIKIQIGIGLFVVVGFYKLKIAKILLLEYWIFFLEKYHLAFIKKIYRQLGLYTLSI